VTFTATYPRTPPLLSIKGDDGLREGTKFKIQKVIETKPKELVKEEQAMIMEIVNACLDVLEDAAQAKAAGLELPSLEEERAAHEATAAKLAEQQREEEEKKKHLESLEEERMLGSLVQDELKRQRAKAKEIKLKNRGPIKLPIVNMKFNAPGPTERLEFDQAISLDVSGGDEAIFFQAVSSKVLIRRGPVSKAFTVRPECTSEAPTLILKQTDLDTRSNDQGLFKKQLQLLEAELEALKKIRHQNVLDLLDFKVHKTIGEDGGELETGWTVSVLTEFAEKGSLEEFLDIAGSLGVSKGRSWTIELLDGLRYLHEHGVLHEDIHAGNILLVRESTGEVRPKLADAGYQRKLHNLGGKKQPTDTVSIAKSAYWLPPEIANTNQPQYSQKTDIWNFGIMFLQMIFGLTVIQKYSSPTSLADSLALSDSLNEFVNKLFKADPKKRPRAFELSSSEFLATDAPVLDEDSSAVVSRLGSMTSLVPPTPRRLRHDSMNTGGPFSRYKEDYVEESRLGKGGFGEVVKARKKLDGHIYAIKKITQKSSASLTEVLKEVRLLSQLSHPYVVRKSIFICTCIFFFQNQRVSRR
jgi:translation initiation factor 2-alpha kinase 4